MRRKRRKKLKTVITPDPCQSARISLLLNPHRISCMILLGLVVSLSCPPSISQDTAAVDEKKAEEKKPQHPYALIFGTVWGPEGAPRYGVTVKIRRADDKNARKARWQVYSDHHGEFAQRIPAGPADYVIWADLKGYKGPDSSKLRPGDETTVHVQNDERIDTGVHLK
jgi:hypothetical protein